MFGDKLKIILEEKGLSQREFSKKCGLTEVSVSRYINNKRIPRMDVCKKIADVLDVNISILISNDPINNTSNDKLFIGKSCTLYRDEKVHENIIILTSTQRITILEDDLIQFLNMNKKKRGFNQ